MYSSGSPQCVMRFKILTAVLLKVQAFTDMMLCWMSGSQHFQGLWTVWSWRWRPYNASKHWELHSQQYSITFQQNWIFNRSMKITVGEETVKVFCWNLKVLHASNISYHIVATFAACLGNCLAETRWMTYRVPDLMCKDKSQLYLIK
jgi:hypothetical protein